MFLAQIWSRFSTNVVWWNEPRPGESGHGCGLRPNGPKQVGTRNGTMGNDK
jgi:hypothetical protein